MDWLESLLFGYISTLLQGVQNLSNGAMLVLVMAFLGIAYSAGHLMQYWLTRQIRRRPKQDARLGGQEVLVSILWPITLPCFAIFSLVRWIREKLNRRKNPSALTEKEAKKDSPQPPKEPIRVATIGPTFFLSGLLSGAVYWTAWLVGPPLARSLGMSPGASFWQVVFLGQRPELAWLLPLQDQPKAALILSLGFWLAVWWTLGNLLRGLAFRSSLRRNHGSLALGSAEAQLPIWRSSFGIVDLVRPGKGYRGWATWLTAVGIVLMVASSMYLGKETGGLVPWDLAIGCVMSLSWILNLQLRGFESPPVSDEGVEAKPSDSNLPSWQDVEAELERVYGYKSPERHFERPVLPLEFEASPRDGATVSPLVSELLASGDQEEPGQSKLRLSSMQKKVLESLSLQGYVHLDPPSDESALTLPGGGATSVEDLSGLSERHQVVLAPEGSGKTTLAMLAAANHALIHASATLMVTRSEAQAKELAKRMGSAADRSTLRWNLRLRTLGSDFASDLSQSIIPDVVVVSLHQLVTGMLDNGEVYYPFLHNVGLVVIDDVESYAGAVEIHAQFAFSRLYLLFRQLAGAEHLVDEMTPQMLILGTDSMKQTGAWAKNLCGVQAAIRLFPHKPQQLAEGGEEAVATNTVQIGFRHSDLRAESGRPLAIAEVIAACETCRVSWHYRSCGDGRRHRGRGPLWLDQEPECACDTAAEAAVLILEGRWPEVRRELRRMPWAGSESGRNEIAVLTVCEVEEEIAFAAIDPGFGLVAQESEFEEGSDLAEHVAMLPLPVIRPPSSLVVQSHLLSDLLQQWVEVKELVDTFKSPVAEALRHLNNQGMLAIEERKDVKPEQKEYELKVYVRALATSLELERVDPSEDGVMEFGLYDKVRQVELVSSEAVAVRSRSAHLLLRRVDANSAGLIYYPGRVFEESRGRFVVVGRTQKAGQPGAIEVEPALQRQVSSPRRFTEIIEEPGLSVPYPCFEPELVLLGRDPISVGLLPIRANLRSMATYRLNPVTGELDSRELHEGQTVQELFQPKALSTVALTLFANPDRLPQAAPTLRFGEARLLATMLRFLLPLIFRDTRDHIEVALSIADKSPPWNQSLGSEDGIYILDLHQGGNGTARAIFREGLALPLRLCRHFLNQVSDLQRLQRLYDHWGDLDEILTDGQPQLEEEALAEVDETSERESIDEETSERLPWPQIRLGLISWLDSRLHPDERSATEGTQGDSEAEKQQEEAA